MRTCGLTLGVLLISGLVEAVFGYRESTQHIETLQNYQATSAAAEIQSYLTTIETVVIDVAKLPWGHPDFDAARGRSELHRAMRQAPAVTELRWLNPAGREWLAASRVAPDRMGTSTDAQAPAEPLAAGVTLTREARLAGTFFLQGHLPATTLTVQVGSHTLAATVDLRLLGDVVRRVRVGEGGIAYVVDESGLLIAHPRATQVLGRRDLSSFEAVNIARNAPHAIKGFSTLSMDGAPVLVTAAPIIGTRWLLFVEQPRSEALAPVLAALTRTALLMVLGGATALVLGVTYARSMAAPIVALRDGVARIARDQLNIEVRASEDDEIEDLARNFNTMSTRLRDLYASLEAKVTERTAQLSEARDVLSARAEELTRLKDEADRANAAKTRFLAAASHDLRQPMHSISLLLGVLQARLDSPEHRALADKIQSSVATMENLFGNLLDISKLDAGAVQAHVENVDLGWLLRQVEQVWAPQAVEKGLSLRVRPCPLLVKGDAALLARIVGNLVANAIRYTRQGGVLVGCRRRGNSVELQVWDNGPGIEPRYREAIFEEFFRIDAPGSGQEKGLGLGLSIVQRSAHILGYALRVDSRVGKGSVFSVTLPVAGEARAPHGGPATATRPPLLAGRFIVVVDDDETNAQALVDALQAQQCHVVAAASCEEVLAALQQHLREPDLIVTDYQLGAGRDGFEVIERLRRHYDDDIAALIVTANTEAALAPRAQACGARLLHKPIGLQRLLEAMQESLPSPDGA